MEGLGKARNYVVTVFAPEGEELRLLDCDSWPEYVSYVVYQRELAPDTGREHFQLYMELSTPYPLTKVRAECEGLELSWMKARKGSQKQAIDYCCKDDSRIEGPWHWGEKKNQGQRVDLEDMRKDLDKNLPMKRIAQDHFPVWIKYPQAVKQYKALIQEQRSTPPEVYVVLGPTGCGKSYWAHTTFPGAYWRPNSMDFYEKYDYEDVMILDEFTGRIPYTDLLQLLDCHPLVLNVKNGAAEMVSKIIVITSNIHPRNWYKEEVWRKHCDSWETSPLKRRLDEFGQIIFLGPVLMTDTPVLVQPNQGINPAIFRQPHTIGRGRGPQ